MTHFPDPLTLPDYIEQQRQERQRQLIKSSIIGIAIRFTIILCEFAGVFMFGSYALLMDALACVIDVIASILLLICVKLAYRPPDENHPFGHGRYEPLIGLQLGLFMVLVGAGMLLQQSFALNASGASESIDPRTWAIPLGAVVLLEISYQIVMRAARQQNSTALAADAIHYRIDGITSLFAALALIGAACFPIWSVIIDHGGAIFIALLMIGMGIYASRQNLNQIMDCTPDKTYFSRVRKAAKSVEGVFDTEKIRIQLYGPDAHVDIDVEVDPHLTVEVAHAISQKVRVEIQKEWSSVRDVTVHVEPYYPADH